jgi:hypothetical protein
MVSDSCIALACIEKVSRVEAPRSNQRWSLRVVDVYTEVVPSAAVSVTVRL